MCTRRKHIGATHIHRHEFGREVAERTLPVCSTNLDQSSTLIDPGYQGTALCGAKPDCCKIVKYEHVKTGKHPGSCWHTGRVQGGDNDRTGMVGQRDGREGTEASVVVGENADKNIVREKVVRRVRLCNHNLPVRIEYSCFDPKRVI